MIKTLCFSCGRYDRSGFVDKDGFWCANCAVIPDSSYYAIEDGTIYGGPYEPDPEEPRL